MDTLLSLRVLAAVAEHKSFAFVAKTLGISKAMTSKHVQHIEARVGARLLYRNSRNVSLTEAGARYLATVRPLLEGLNDAEVALSEAAQTAQGTLRVTTPVWMANPPFAAILAQYHRENPGVILDLDLSGRKINLVEEGVDLAIRVAASLDDGLIARRLGEVEFPLVASPSFLDAFGRPTSVDDLSGAPLMLYTQMETSGRIRFGSGEDALDIRFTPAMRTGNEILIHLGAQQGMGFAFVPHWLAANDLEHGVLERVLPDTPWPRVPLFAVYADRKYLPAKVRTFLDFLAGPKGVSSFGPPKT